MASHCLETLFLRARDQHAATGRRAHLAVLALVLIHAAVVTPWIERQLARTSDEAEQRRFAELPEIATLDGALQEAAELARETLEPALERLAGELAADLAGLGATVNRLRAEAVAEDDGATAIDSRPLPFAIEDGERLAVIRDAVAEAGPASSGSRYGLLAALDPVVEEEIARPRFAAIHRDWKENALPLIEARLDDVAAALPALRLRFAEARREWSAFEGALTGLRASARDLDLEPPAEPFWWASPETSRELEIGLPPATAEKIRRPPALGGVSAAFAHARRRYDELAERLERERARARAAAAARERREQDFAGLLAQLGVDLGAVIALFPLLLGIVLAAAMARRNQRLRELGVAARLTLEEGGPPALRDWCLAELAGRLSDERTADEAWRAGWTRALGVLALAFAWIAAAALQVRQLDGIDDQRWLTVTLAGAGAVLAATIHRLVVARGLSGLFVASDSETIGDAPDEPPEAVHPEDEPTAGDSELDAHTWR